MPGLRAPTDYSQEPSRHPALLVNSKEPFNAEPPRSSYVTPVEFFYKRNHGPVPIADDIEKCNVSMRCLVENPKKLYMKDILKLPKYVVTATLQEDCHEQNSKGERSRVGHSAIGNAVWGGARFADVLELVRILNFSHISQSGGKHVEFVSIDRCKEENEGPCKSSIPLSMATNPEADVLIAYEMNGETLNRDHGYPLRVIVPGVIGARSVKWLDSINIIAQESQGFFMQKDYKMFPPSVDWDNIDWSTRPQMDFPVQSAICSLDDRNNVKPGKVDIAGMSSLKMGKSFGT
ncbi:Sulfite oxidase, molybdopterin-binding component [Handroanthus impetiginosus]|uniref:Sulfite oxidase, molybdopterin-binding component n=1 Tax=Handroanthus impetiginosus TaxID=429701 RepID=A0A2G9G9N6_9LAMI|nr:Sulfite oxidase, molybdopterin-binding component [Handroanthus impetiginosus]